MNKVKRIVASLAATVTVGAVSLSAAAYSDPPFDVSISYNSYKWSKPATKEDNSNKAGVHARGGNVSSQSPVYVTIYSKQRLGNVDRVSGTIYLNKNKQDKDIFYTDTFSPNNSYYLLFETGAYSATVSGFWNP